MLIATLADGSEVTLTSSSAWTAVHGPIVYDHLWHGEIYDSRRPHADEHRSAPDPRHSGRANTTFADGHAESMSLEELGYRVESDGVVAARGEGATNRLFSGILTDALAPGLNGPATEP